MNNKWRVLLIIQLTWVLSACSSHQEHEKKFEKEYKQALKQAQKQVEPLPDYSLMKKVRFKSQFNPFDINYAVVNVKKIDLPKRAKTPLEAYSLNSFEFVGVVGDNNRIDAVFVAPDGIFYRAKIGDYIGQKNGRITRIEESGIVDITIPKQTFSGKVVNDVITLRHEKE